MEVVRRVWSFLDGKKTVIGTALAVLYSGAVAQGLMERDATIEWAIASIFGVGVGHKVVKKTQ